MNRIDLYLHDLYPPSLYDRKDSWNTAMSRGLPGEWQQMKAAIKWNHGQVRLVPSLIPRVSLFQLVGTWLVYSFHPGTQVPVEPNVQLDFRVVVSFFWRHLQHNGHLKIYYAYFSWQKEEEFLKIIGLFLPSGNTSSGRVKFAAGLSCHCLFLLETSFWHPKTTKLNLIIWNSLTVRRSLYFNGHNLQTRLWMLVLAIFISRPRDQVQRWRIYRDHYTFLGNCPPTPPQRQHQHLILT